MPQEPLFVEEPEALDEVVREMLGAAASRFPGRHVIPGDGPSNARLAFVGESPGVPDIESGRPFMGPSGELLERIIAAIGFRRESVFLTNVVKIVSDGEEVTTDLIGFFRPYLIRELRAIGPRVIVALGGTPAKTLIGTNEPISRLRGRFFEFEDARLMPTFNPAYLLRDPTKKREVWEDMKLVRDAVTESG